MRWIRRSGRNHRVSSPAFVTSVTHPFYLDPMPWKELFSAAALVLTFVIFIPYIRSIRAGRTRPHMFSWIIWGLGTFVVFLAQLAGGGGIGAWPIGVSGLITFYVAWLAWSRRADTTITRTDWLFFITALAAIPAWIFT